MTLKEQFERIWNDRFAKLRPEQWSLGIKLSAAGTLCTLAESIAFRWEGVTDAELETVKDELKAALSNVHGLPAPSDSALLVTLKQAAEKGTDRRQQDEVRKARFAAQGGQP